MLTENYLLGVEWNAFVYDFAWKIFRFPLPSKSELSRISVLVPLEGNQLLLISAIKSNKELLGNGEVHNTIRDILGPDVNLGFTVVPYFPLNRGNPAEIADLYTNARGSVLFQYDPNSDGEGKRRWRVLLEDTLRFKDLPALTT